MIFIYSLANAKENSVLDNALELNKDFANWIDEKAHNLDLALSGKVYIEETEDSKLVISQGVYWREGNEITYKTDIDLRLRLPNLEEKYKLVISNYNEDKERRSSYSTTEQDEREDKDYGASIAFIRKIGDFDIRFRPRIQIKNPVETFYTLQFENELKYKDHSLTTELKLFADSRKGTGQFASIKYRAAPIGPWGQTLVFEEEYQDAKNYFSLLQGYTIHLKASDKIIFNQSFIFRSDNNPVPPEHQKSAFKLKNINVSPSMTHEILPDVLHYTLTYSHFFNRQINFKGRNAVFFNVDLIF